MHIIIRTYATYIDCVCVGVSVCMGVCVMYTVDYHDKFDNVINDTPVVHNNF